MVVFVCDGIAQKTYRSALNLWLGGRSRYWHLFADEAERMLPLSLFLVGLFVVDETANANFGGSVLTSAVALLVFLTAITAISAVGRLYWERRKQR